MRALSLALVLSILAVLAASGCIIPTTASGNGVVIDEFSSGGLSELYPGEDVTFFLKVSNQGSVTATDVFAELLGLDEDWAKSSGSLTQNDGLIVGGEVLPQESRCQYTQSAADHYTLQAPDPVYGTAGETATCTWKYRAPSVPEGMKPEYKLTARVFYDYHTDLVKSFTILPTSELQKHNQQGLTIPSSTVSLTSSPVTITAQARDPIRFWDNGGVSFPLAITISNSGGGMACAKDKCKKSEGADWNKVSLKINPSQGLDLSDECAQFNGGADVEVWPNRDNSVICNIEVSGTSDITSLEERTIRITATYSYFTDAGTTITVL